MLTLRIRGDKSVRPSPSMPLKKRALRWFIFFVLIFVALPVSAREFMQGNDCTIPVDSTVEGTLFVFCEVLLIDGTIEGNVIGFALRAMLNGTVEGDVYLTGGQFDMRGYVHSNVHYGGAVLHIMRPLADDADDATEILEPVAQAGTIGGDLFSATLSTHLHAQAQLMGESITLGYQFINDGIIERSVSFWGSALHTSGRIHGDVYADVGDPNSDGGQIATLLFPFQFDLNLVGGGMNIARGAVIRGQLSYTSPARGTIEGRIIRGITFTETATIVLPTLEEPRTLTIYFDQFMREATTLMSIGLLMIFIAPSAIQRPIAMMRSRPLPSIIVGMLSFIISFPIVLIMLVMSILLLSIFELLGLRGVTIAGSVVLSLFNIGGMSLFYFMAIFVARALVGLAIGRVLLRLLLPQHAITHRMSAQIILGTLVLALSASLPVIGWVFNALALFLGLGAILTILLEKFRLLRDSAPQVAPYAPRDSVNRPRPIMPNVPIVPPVPPPSASPPPLPSAGMEALPDGFKADWFFEGE